MIRTEKLIVCVAPTSNLHGKESNPALPYYPEEIAEEVYKCWNEGAAIAHIHARDDKGGPTNDPEVFCKIDEEIRKKKCNIIIQHSTAPAFRTESLKRGEPGDVEAGMRSLEAKPEMASLNMGVVSSGFRGMDRITPYTRYFIEKSAERMRNMGIKPEMEVYNSGMMENLYNLVEKGLLSKPFWVSFVLSMNRVNHVAVRYTPKALLNYVDMLPEEAMFSTLGIGIDELPATTLSILLGGHVRVGFEDNIHYGKGKLANSNAQLVARIIHFGRELGREPATPDEAREFLGIPKLKT